MLGITELKDLLWRELTRETFKDTQELVRQPMPTTEIGEEDDS
jgi:hypothetical protein